MDDCFEKCQMVVSSLYEGRDEVARTQLISILDGLEKDGEPYSELVNHLIRVTGLYPYLKTETALWQDVLVHEMFRVNVGGNKEAVLHRDQSELLKRLLKGESLVVSAPTSFGKSFVIDALLSIKHPDNVVIIVPTIALTDETRRRIYVKFARDYQIITTPEVQLGERNIFIFPQERAFGYLGKIPKLDLLIIDEFYKADVSKDPRRAVSLMKLLAQMKDRAKQCYFLMPNIDRMSDSPFTKGLEHVEFNMKTVVLKHHNLYKKIKRDEDKKRACLLHLLEELNGHKTLVYVKSYSEQNKVAELLTTNLTVCKTGSRSSDFSVWLQRNYAQDWSFATEVSRGVVRHNGKLHRALAQLVVHLFEDDDQCLFLIATSSLIEGVNTSAENVILWNNKKHIRCLDPFTYKNIIGRGGRMFRHFVGNVYNLEEPPQSVHQELLDLGIPDEKLIEFSDETSQQYLTKEQVAAIKAQQETIKEEIGPDVYKRVFQDYSLVSMDAEQVKHVWHRLKWPVYTKDTFACLLTDDVRHWSNALSPVIDLLTGDYKNPKLELKKKLLSLIKIARLDNWRLDFPTLLGVMQKEGIDIDLFFKLERDMAFEVASLFQDFNVIQLAVYEDAVDLTPFVRAMSSAFLPPRVYELEEYGLPRMVARKIHNSGLVDLECEMPLETILRRFRELGVDKLKSIPDMDEFDHYILEYFYKGIQIT